jgi:hypothetical protein
LKQIPNPPSTDGGCVAVELAKSTAVQMDECSDLGRSGQSQNVQQGAPERETAARMEVNDLGLKLIYKSTQPARVS